MKFLLQIKLLLWKNFLLRKRQKLRCLVEFVWPLFLFLILMWVRTRGLKKYVHECHFEEKAMPSAGVVPFLQSFMCSINNTCHRNVQQSRNTMQNFNSTPFWNLMEGMEVLLGQRVGKKEVNNIEAATGDIMAFAQLVQGISTRQQQLEGTLDLRSIIKDPKELKNSLLSQRINISEVVIDTLLSSKIALQNLTTENLAALQKDPRSVVCDVGTISRILKVSGPAEISQISSELCSLPNSNLTSVTQTLSQNVRASGLWNELLRYTELNLGKELSWSSWSDLRRLVSEVAEDIESLNTFQDSLNEVGAAVRQYLPPSGLELNSNSTKNSNSSFFSPAMLTEVALFQSLLCGPNTTNILDQIAAGGGESTRFDELKDQLADSESEFDEYVNDTEASVECNNLFRTLERNSLTRFLWSQVKPLIRGKILYAPNDTVVDKIMTRVNDSFTFIVRAQETGQMIATSIIPRLREILLNQSIGLKILQDVWPQTFSTLQRLLGPQMKSQLDSIEKFAEKFFDDNSTATREMALDMLETQEGYILTALECFDVNKLQGFATEAEAVERGMELIQNNKLWAVVSFIDEKSNNQTSDELPPFVTYKIRLDSSRVDSTKRVEDMLRRPGPRRRPGIDMKYITYGFAYIQDLLEASVIKEHTGRSSTPGYFLQQFPYPCYIIDRFVLAISRTFPLFMTISWVYTSAMIVKSIVYEKERRLKETMRVMGLGNGVHWLGWFIDSITPMILTIFCLTLVLVYGNVLENSDPSLIFVFMLTYTFTTVIKCFLISVFFSKANLAAAAGGIIFFVLYLPYAFTVIWEERMPSYLKAFACLISNVAFGYGCSYLSHFEETGQGAQWSNFHKSPLLDDKLSLQACMLLLLLDGAIYAVLTWYIEAVFPGEYGVPKPWYFPFMKSYWCGKEEPFENCPLEPDLLNDHVSSENFEAEPTNLSVGVSLQNLGKTYGNGKLALNNLSINFYQDQITAFLGHNGAGKTTTISILTGIFPPSRGTATVNGLDIRKDMDSIRGSLGTCPQHNVLFDDLTVEEHLWFYARIKGRDEAEVSSEAEKMILDLGLPHKKNELAKNLSGGMQRKLSIAVAFIGGSKTVILDEPTSGVDPFSRRSIWELLLKYKKDRTVILTTHFMDEADLLADRIAIIAGGSLRCCGSGLFLKARFGSGFYLTIERTRAISERPSSPNNTGVLRNGWINGAQQTDNQIEEQVHQISEAVQTCVPSAFLLEAVGQELVFTLPLTLQLRQSALPMLQTLLDTLDSRSASLGINCYGISDTSLEEIFLKVAENAEQGAKEEEQDASRSTVPRLNSNAVGQVNNDDHSHEMQPLGNGSVCTNQNGTHRAPTNADMKAPTSDGTTFEINAGDEYWSSKEGKRKLRWRQFLALQTKRFHHTKRDPKALFCEIILPALFVCLALTFTVIMPGLQEEPALELKPWIYKPPSNVFFEMQTPDNAWAQRYQEQFLGQFGMGTKCVGPNAGTCTNETAKFDIMYSANETFSMISPSCSCNLGTQVCPRDAGGPPPPKAKVSKGDILIDLTNRNISDWIVKTEEGYYKIRYGGFSFGIYNPINGVNVSRLVLQLGRLDAASNLGQSRFPDYQSLAESLDERARQQDSFDNIKVWYNNKGWAASVSYLNAMNNVVLRASLPSDKQNQSHLYGIRAINHPMNFTPTQLQQESIKQSGISLLHAISVIFAMSFVPASFVVTLIEERASKAKHLQFVSGVDAIIYWVAAFCWDFASYFVSATLCVFIFLLFNEQAYVSDENLPGLVLLLILYGWSSIPLMYPASFVASVPSTAFVFLACANLFVGIVTTVATFVLEILDDAELQFIASILREVFLIFPHFCLGQGLMKMATNHLAAETLASFGIEFKKNRFAWDFLGKNLLSMTIAGFVFFGFTLALQFRLFVPTWQKLQAFVQGTPRKFIPKFGEEREEEDVILEKQRVLQESENQDVLRLENLTKVYKPGTRPAVNKLCFGVHKAECFGLLGLNGAGKTSTFKMLTGDSEITSGDAFVCGHSVTSELPLVRKQLGYCPQFDALDPLLTAREHLEFYSRLRGVPSHLLHAAVDEGLARLGLLPYADRCAGTYSGGNKRKLSTAIALVGNPPLVFLDEPTSGMDPAARRFLWRCILRTVREGRSVLLTSHSMEECQALCSRLTVMVNGQLACLGSAQHLKSKFGNGYTLVVRCPVEQAGAVEAHMLSHLPEAMLSESHHTRLRFQLPSNSNKLSAALGALEQARTKQLIYDYSVSQTTLEEVFLRFADQQSDLSIDDYLNCSCFKSFWPIKKKFKH